MIAGPDDVGLRSLAAERQVDRLGDRPLSTIAIAQPLLCAQRVDRHLQGASWIRRASRLVVDNAQPVAGEQIDPIGDAFQCDRPSLPRSQCELALEAILEPTLANIRGRSG